MRMKPAQEYVNEVATWWCLPHALIKQILPKAKSEKQGFAWRDRKHRFIVHVLSSAGQALVWNEAWFNCIIASMFICRLIVPHGSGFRQPR